MSEEFQNLIFPYHRRCPGCKLKLERKIAIPKCFQIIGMTYEYLEQLEDDILVCPSECGYFKRAKEPLYTFKFNLDDVDMDDPPEDKDEPDLPRQLPLWPE
jgi:hypothetical protein